MSLKAMKQALKMFEDDLDDDDLLPSEGEMDVTVVKPTEDTEGEPKPDEETPDVEAGLAMLKEKYPEIYEECFA